MRTHVINSNLIPVEWGAYWISHCFEDSRWLLGKSTGLVLRRRMSGKRIHKRRSGIVKPGQADEDNTKGFVIERLK